MKLTMEVARVTWILFMFTAFVVPNTSAQQRPIQYYRFTIDHANPYNNFTPPTAQQLQLSESQIITQYTPVQQVRYVRQRPQWVNVVHRPVLVGYGNRFSSQLTSNYSIDQDKGSRSRRQFQKLQNQQPEQEQQQQQPHTYYNCDSVIRDERFIMESPHYPATYPLNRICTFYIAKNRSDVCQIEVTISDMDIEDTPRCTADYLDLGGGQDDRLCGLMLRNTRRFIMFPNNGSYIHVTFRSDSKNPRPYRGFSAEVTQLPNTCYTTPFNNTPGDAKYPVQTPQQVPFGQRLYPPTRGLVYPQAPLPDGRSLTPQYPQRPISDGRGFSSQYPQQPIPEGRGLSPPYSGQQPTYDNRYSPSLTNQSDVYLASYCDVFLGDSTGEIRSPGYPFGYPTNHSCVYTIKKSSPDVCQLELIFHHFDIQTPNEKKDLTDNCSGDYLEMPDHTRLCGFYTQAMSKEHKLKKYYLFYDTSDYLFIHFYSDNQQTPDGSGFWIEVKQLRNTCNANFDYQKVKCDRAITSYSMASVNRIYSPNYPQFYGPRHQCVYFVKPMDTNTCEFELDLVQFTIEDSGKEDDPRGKCVKDFFQLPDRMRICGHVTFRKLFQFPKYHDRISMFYFHSDDQIENQGYEIVVKQIPNSCKNMTINNQNVYTVSDPNLPYNPPTPVFTYNNNSGLQPLNPVASTFGFNPSPYDINRGKTITGIEGKTSVIASQLPNFLNDPRNVDSSGTIPLYFANGTLATRIPPLKPVDMITFLKKGKTFVQKGSSGFDGKNLFTSIKTPNEWRDVLANRYPQSEISRTFDSSDRLISPRSDRTISREADPILSPLQMQPTYNCDQVVTRPIEYIRSPNFPSNYPTVTRCIYSILKTDNTVCQVRLHVLSFDLEYTNGCKNDYLQVETTGEKLCGRFSQPETRVINYYGFSRDIRLIFNSDRQTTNPGFEVRIEQVPNSCQDTNQNSSLSSMISRAGSSINPNTSRSFVNSDSPLISSSSGQRATRTGRLKEFGDAPEAQALTINQSVPTNSPPMSRICQTTALAEAYIESENFPLPYPINTNCEYKVFRANLNVCRIEIEFIEFSVGIELQANNQIEADLDGSRANCVDDYFEIDNVRYCGTKPGKTIAVNFPRNLAEISFRFVSTSLESQFNGFRIKVKQIDQNCRSSKMFGINDPFGDEMNDFSPPVIESCPKQSNNTDIAPSALIQEKLVKIQSPEFSLSSSMTYKPFLDCNYVIQKYSRDVCAIEAKFESFSLEESRTCTKDFLEINKELKLCGKVPLDTTRTFDFQGDTFRIQFHTDADIGDSGFSLVLRQIRC